LNKDDRLAAAAVVVKVVIMKHGITVIDQFKNRIIGLCVVYLLQVTHGMIMNRQHNMMYFAIVSHGFRCQIRKCCKRRQ